MSENDIKRLVRELLDNYCSCQILDSWQLGINEYRPVFTHSLYWHSIYIVDSSTGSCLQKCVLKGKTIAEVAAKMCLVFKDPSQWLEVELHTGKKIIIRPGDGTNAPEKFIVEYELLSSSTMLGMAEDKYPIDLAKRVLDFFKIELQVRPVSHLVWPTAAEDGDRVVLIYDFSREAGEKKQLEHGTLLLDSHGILQESSLFIDDIGEDEKLLFLESLGMLIEVRYGLDIRTLEPKRVVVNPFFKCKSFEEIGVKLDLIEEKNI